MSQLPYQTMNLIYPSPTIYGLDAQTQDLLSEMWSQWLHCLPRNFERMLYLDGKNRIKDLQVSLPPHLVDRLEIVMGWPAKAVYELANRIVFEGITTPDASEDPFELKRVLRDNRFQVEFPQTIASTLSMSTSFGITLPGDKGAGEPGQLLMFYSAMWATGLWDNRRRGLKAGMLINEIDELGTPNKLTILLWDCTIICVNPGNGWYVQDKIPHSMGRPPIEAIPFRPTLDRPFGRARIDRQVMSLTDRGVRQSARLEVHSELYSALQLYMLGASEDMFVDESGRRIPMWDLMMGRFNIVPYNEEGELPKIEKILAQSPEPQIAVMRQLTAEFSGHTGVPMSSLGISTDNAESADSKKEAREDIINDAENQHIVAGGSLHRLFENLVMIREGLSEPPKEMLDMSFKWRRPDRPTLVAIADAGSKQLGTLEALKNTEVGMELAGLDPSQIARARAELRRAKASEILSQSTSNDSSNQELEER